MTGRRADRLMSQTKTISVVIIESSEIVRERIVALVSRLTGIVIVAAAATGAEGLTLSQAERPDVVMLGLELEDMNGMKFIQRLRESRPDCRIIALTNCPFKGILQLSLECGADFCFDKTGEFQRALDVCQELASGSGGEGMPAIPPRSGSLA